MTHQMTRLKNLGFHQINTLLNLKYPPLFHPQNTKPLNKTTSNPSIHTKSLKPTSVFKKSTTLSSEFQHIADNKEIKKTEDAKIKKSLLKLELELTRNEKDSFDETKTLEMFFKEAVGLSKDGQDQETEKGVGKLSNLFLSGDRRAKTRTECKKVEEVMELKKLSPEMGVFASYLHKKGYFVKANFVSDDKFDVSCFENNYGRDFLKFAAEEFAKDHRDIYKWLPTGDLKVVAQFGCPSLGRKTVFSAKAMRFCYGIREETVCDKCAMKQSCKFANQSVWKKGAKNMDLAVVMRVITLYALPTQFEVPDDVRNAVNRLLKEIVRLSEIDS